MPSCRDRRPVSAVLGGWGRFDSKGEAWEVFVAMEMGCVLTAVEVTPLCLSKFT